METRGWPVLVRYENWSQGVLWLGVVAGALLCSWDSAAQWKGGNGERDQNDGSMTHASGSIMRDLSLYRSNTAFVHRHALSSGACSFWTWSQCWCEFPGLQAKRHDASPDPANPRGTNTLARIMAEDHVGITSRGREQGHGKVSRRMLIFRKKIEHLFDPFTTPLCVYCDIFQIRLPFPTPYQCRLRTRGDKVSSLRCSRVNTEVRYTKS
jgi:hypothetical protein